MNGHLLTCSGSRIDLRTSPFNLRARQLFIAGREIAQYLTGQRAGNGQRGATSMRIDPAVPRCMGAGARALPNVSTCRYDVVSIGEHCGAASRGVSLRGLPSAFVWHLSLLGDCVTLGYCCPHAGLPACPSVAPSRPQPLRLSLHTTTSSLFSAQLLKLYSYTETKLTKDGNRYRLA